MYHKRTNEPHCKCLHGKCTEKGYDPFRLSPLFYNIDSIIVGYDSTPIP